MVVQVAPRRAVAGSSRVDIAGSGSKDAKQTSNFFGYFTDQGGSEDVPEAKKTTRKAAPKKAAKKAARKRVSAPEGEAIAITGAGGFLGAQVLSYLRSEQRFERVVVLDIAKPTLPIRKTKFYKTDLTEPNCDARIAEIFEKENVTQVVHLAFFRNPHRNQAYAHELEVIGTLHLLHACA